MKLEFLDVGDETRVPDAFFRKRGAFPAEVAFFAPEAAGKLIRIVKDKVVVVINVKYRRRVAVADKAHRFASLAVEVLVPGVEWHRKERALLPFESLLLAVVEPDAGVVEALRDVITPRTSVSGGSAFLRAESRRRKPPSWVLLEDDPK